jgi:hypothetical protein
MLSENAKFLLQACEPLLEKLLRYKGESNRKGKDMKGKRG